ncbi:unnamed protein product [Camellia sinensis]
MERGAWNRGQNRVGGRLWTRIEDSGVNFIQMYGGVSTVVDVLGSNTGTSAVGVFRVWIREDVFDHGSGDGSRFCSAVVVGFDRPWVCLVVVSIRSFESEKKCSDHGSGAGCLTVLGVYRSW